MDECESIECKVSHNDIQTSQLCNLIVMLENLVKQLHQNNHVLMMMNRLMSGELYKFKHNNGNDETVNSLKKEEIRLRNDCKLLFEKYKNIIDEFCVNNDNDTFKCLFLRLNLTFDDIEDDDSCVNRNVKCETQMPIKVTRKSERIVLKDSSKSKLKNKESQLIADVICEENSDVEECDDNYDDDYDSDDIPKKTVKRRASVECSPLSKRKRSYPHKFRCDWVECHRTFSHKRNLDIHRMYHTGEYPFPCTDDGCEMKFRTERACLLHQKRFHLKDRPFKCETCGKDFSLDYDLQKHQLTVHVNGKMFHCQWSNCGRSYSTKHELIKHTRRKHTQDLTYPCIWPGCGEKFATKHELNVHSCIHTNDGKWKCQWPNCGRAFVLKRALMRHLTEHSEEFKKFHCHWPGCDMRFVTEKEMMTHQLVHSKEKRYKCDWPGCSFESSWKSPIDTHRRTHTGEKPYKCQICGAQIRDSSNFSKHKKKHQK